MKKRSPLLIWSTGCGVLVVLSMLFSVLAQGEAKTARLLKKELVSLEDNRLLIVNAQQAYATYSDDIETINGVFPTDVTIPLFVQRLETAIQASAETYSVKFTSLTPLAEEERLYLLVTLTMRTDEPRFFTFLSTLETLPYMTHITSIANKYPDGPNGLGEYTVGLKIYVQKPFTAR